MTKIVLIKTLVSDFSGDFKAGTKGVLHGEKRDWKGRESSPTGMYDLELFTYTTSKNVTPKRKGVPLADSGYKTFEGKAVVGKTVTAQCCGCIYEATVTKIHKDGSIDIKAQLSTRVEVRGRGSFRVVKE